MGENALTMRSGRRGSNPRPSAWEPDHGVSTPVPQGAGNAHRDGAHVPHPTTRGRLLAATRGHRPTALPTAPDQPPTRDLLDGERAWRATWGRWHADQAGDR